VPAGLPDAWHATCCASNYHATAHMAHRLLRERGTRLAAAARHASGRRAAAAPQRRTVRPGLRCAGEHKRYPGLQSSSRGDEKAQSGNASGLVKTQSVDKWHATC